MKKINKPIPIEYFYDAEGTCLYKRIIQEKDYYLYQTEKKLLEEQASTLSENIPLNSIILEIGCGTAEKILPLIQQSTSSPHHCCFVANDISPTFLETTQDYYQSKNIKIETLVGNIFQEAHLVRERFPTQPIVLCWLGSSFLNFPISKGLETLQYLLETIQPDMILLGYDNWNSNKTELLKKAYDNTITEQFIRNGYVKYLAAKGKKLSTSAQYHVEICENNHRVEMGVVDKNQFRIVECSYKINQEAFSQMMTTLHLFPVTRSKDSRYDYEIGLFRTHYGLQPQKLWRISQKKPDQFHDVSYAIQKLRHDELRLHTNSSLASYATPLQSHNAAQKILDYWVTLTGSFLGQTSHHLNHLVSRTHLVRTGTVAITSVLQTLDLGIRTLSSKKNRKKNKKKKLVVRLTPDYRPCSSSLQCSEIEFLDIPYHWTLEQAKKTIQQHQDHIIAMITTHPSAPLGQFHPEWLHFFAGWITQKNWLWIVDEILLPTLSRKAPNDLFSFSIEDVPICVIGGLGKLGLEEFSPTFVCLLGNHKGSDFPTTLGNRLTVNKLTSQDLSRVVEILDHSNWKSLQNKRKQLLSKKRKQFEFLFTYCKIDFQIYDSICAWIDVSRWITTERQHKEFYHSLFTQYQILVTPGEVLGKTKPGYFRIRYTAPYHILRFIAKSIFQLLDTLNPQFISHYYQELFQEAKQTSNLVFSLIQSKFLTLQPVQERRPFVFYQGHIPAFLWIILRRAFNVSPIQEEYEILFERGIDPSLRTGKVHQNSVDTVAKITSSEVIYPTSEEISTYEYKVRKESSTLIQKTCSQGLDSSNIRPFLLGLEHEYMHQETLMYMIQKTPLEWFRLENIQECLTRTIPDNLNFDIQWMRVPSNQIYLGRHFAHDNNYEYVWDNEYGAQYIDMPECWMCRYPITNGQFLEFVEDDGYQNSEFWSEEHWEFIQKKEIRSPENWLFREKTWWVRFPCREVVLHKVLGYAVSVSLAEAKAFSNWYNKKHKVFTRIPTEKEWLQAVEMDSPQLPPIYQRLYQSDIGKLRRLEPMPIQQNSELENKYGVSHLVGNGWELTSSLFKPLNTSTHTFQPDTYYPNYSQDFFDGDHYVLKGASWATPVRMVRPSFRNFFQDLYRYAFTQFRLVSSKKPR